LRLQRLTGLERDKIAGELEEIAKQIVEYLEILGSRERLLEILREELLDMKARFATPRRTEILEGEGDYDDEDLIQREGGVARAAPAWQPARRISSARCSFVPRTRRSCFFPRAAWSTR
jgi:DNA gyrase subunit A